VLAGHKEDGAYHASSGNLWRVTFSDLLHEVTPGGTLVRTFALPAATPNLVGLEWVGSTLYGSDYTSESIGVIALTSDSTATYTPIPWAPGGAPPGGNPGDWTAGLAYDGQAGVLYLATYSSTRLFQITFAAGEATATLVTTLSSVGYASGAIADGLCWVPPLATSIGATDSRESPFALAASPSPFAASTELRFRVPAAGPVLLEIWDVAGRRVRTLFSGAAAAGSRSVTWDGRSDSGSPAPDGVYFSRLTVGSLTEQAKLVRVR
jgi:hypothetical protein